MRKLAPCAAIAVLLAVLASSASAQPLYGSDGCGRSGIEPKTISFSCEDGKLVFEEIEWMSWGPLTAVASGSLNRPELDHPVCAGKTALACPWSRTAATATLSRPVFCPTNGRLQFTHLRLEAPGDPDPGMRELLRDYSCGEYASEQTIARWRPCGDQPRGGAGWYEVMAVRVGCATARAVARRYTWSRFSGSEKPSPFGFSCWDHAAGRELTRVFCRRTVGSQIQKVKFEYGA